MAFNTGNPIGSTDARDLSDNAQDFDQAVNQRNAPTWTDRLGVTRKTVFGAFQEITYKAPVAYAAGISFLTTDANKTVEDDGVIYAPLNSALPFTTSGTFSGDDDARFYPVQDKNNVIRVTSIAAMEAYSAPVGYVFSLNAGGRSGVFDVIAGDFSTELAADTLNGVYVGLADDPTATTKVAIRRNRKKVSPGMFGAVGDGTTDDTLTIQAGLDLNIDLVINKDHMVTGLDLTSYTGTVSGRGKVIAKPATAIPTLINMSGSIGATWKGVGVDMSQTASSTLSDAVAVVGVNLRDARDCTIKDFEIYNIREGRPFIVDGTSSNSPSASDGAKRIMVDGVKCVAFEYNLIDGGAYCYVRSDFFTGTGGGIYNGATNATKNSDYTLDESVAYARTTEFVTIQNCYFENHDRFAFLNCKNVSVKNNQLINFYTRGYTMSPSCESIIGIGGTISGGAAQINANYACKDIHFSNMVMQGGRAIGEKTGIRLGYGANRCSFTNISGVGGDDSLCHVEGANNVLFSGVSLIGANFGRASTDALLIDSGGGGNSTTFETNNIKFENCYFKANYSILVGSNGNQVVLAQGAVSISNTYFERSFEFVRGTPRAGLFCFNGVRENNDAPKQALSPKAFRFFINNDQQLQMNDSVTLAGATSYPTFPTVWYWVPDSSADGTRNPPVSVFRNRGGVWSPLLYGVHWFVDGTKSGAMYDRIRMYDAGVDAINGDVIHIIRHS